MKKFGIIVVALRTGILCVSKAVLSRLSISFESPLNCLLEIDALGLQFTESAGRYGWMFNHPAMAAGVFYAPRSHNGSLGRWDGCL